jgi:hypothetical protein
MADKRISQLVDRGTVANSDVVPIVVSGASTTNKATISSIQTFMQGNLDLGVTSVGLSMPSAFTVTGSPVTSSGNISVVGAGTVSQYIRGDGSLADFPQGGGGGGASVSYYLNLSVSQGSIGGIAYSQMSRVPVFGAGTDTAIASNGYIASFITDAGNPALLEIPAGNWNFETYFSANSNAGSPKFYIELYKVNSGGTATLIASNSATPEEIYFGTTIHAYFSALAVPTTSLTLTDRLAIRIYVLNSGRTITLHTENSNLCQVITTFTTGLTALNGLTAQVQNFATGSSGTDFGISSSTSTHTFNLPTASATNRGALSSADWTTFNGKQAALNGTGFVKISGTTISYDNSTYLTTSSAASTYLPLVGGTLTGNLNGTTSIFGSAFATNQTSKIGIGFESGYGRINSWGADASTYGGLSFEISASNGGTYQALRINPDGTIFAPAGGYYGLVDAGFLKVGAASGFSQALTPPVAKFVNSANNFVKIALGQGETSPNFNDYYGIIALDNSTTLANNKLRFYLGYDDAANTHSNDQLVIQGDGNVGINTASPSSKLTIVKGSHTSTIGSSSVLQISDTSAAGEAVGDRAEINFYTNSDSISGNLQHATIGIIKTSAVGNETADLYFGTSTIGGSAVERMRITSAGVVQVMSGNELRAYRSDNARYGSFFTDNLAVHLTSSNDPIRISSADRTEFYTAGTERMRITSGGYLKASNTGTYVGSTGAYHELVTNANNFVVAEFRNTNASSPYGINVQNSGVTLNNAANYLYQGVDGSTARFIVFTNGGIHNYQANNLNLSDERTKKDIEPLESYWNKFKAIEIVKFKYKDQTHDDYNIGVIAQQVESVAPEFVDVDGWGETVEGEEPLKSIYTADLHHATIKVLQEAMAKIEKLEKEIDSLKNQMQ